MCVQPNVTRRPSKVWSTGSTVHELAVAKFVKSKYKIWDRVAEKNTLILEIPEFPYRTAKGSFHIKTSLKRSVVSIRNRFVTDTQAHDDIIHAYRASV